MDMTNREMILTSLGFFKNDNKLDTFRSYFGYDWTDEDLNEAIEASGYDLTSVRNCLVEILWLKVVDEFGAEAASVNCLIVGSMARLIHTSTSNRRRLATDRK